MRDASLLRAGVLPPAWIHNMTARELEQTVPTWHAVFAFYLPSKSCGEHCAYAKQVVDFVAHKVYMDATLRTCVSIVNVIVPPEAKGGDSAATDGQQPDYSGIWIPSQHELHSKHDKREVRAGAAVAAAVGAAAGNAFDTLQLG